MWQTVASLVPMVMTPAIAAFINRCSIENSSSVGLVLKTPELRLVIKSNKQEKQTHDLAYNSSRAEIGLGQWISLVFHSN